MKPKRIVREPEAYSRLGCRRTKFRKDYRFHSADDPNVPGTDIPRLRPVELGPRNVGFVDSEIDDLIDALVELRDAPGAGAPTHVFLTDAMPPKLFDARLKKPHAHAARALQKPNDEAPHETAEGGPNAPARPPGPLKTVTLPRKQRKPAGQGAAKR